MTVTRYTSPDAAVARALTLLGTGTDTYGPTLNTTASAADAETIGTALAEALRAHRIEAVLAHVVARELGATVHHADELEGLVTFQPEIVPDTRAALIATAWPEPQRLATLLAAVGNHWAQPAAVAAVVATSVLRSVKELPTVHLAVEVDAA